MLDRFVKQHACENGAIVSAWSEMKAELQRRALCKAPTTADLARAVEWQTELLTKLTEIVNRLTVSIIPPLRKEPP